MPRAAGDGPGCAARHRESADSPRSRPVVARSSRARARSWKVGRFAYHAGRALEIQCWWSAGLAAGIGLSDGEPFPALRAPPLQYFSPALGLHSLAACVGLLPSVHIGLKRPLRSEERRVGNEGG